ncbi:MAG: BamA/TamA family outer membrane protein [Bryobacteraceae bacterium]
MKKELAGSSGLFDPDAYTKIVTAVLLLGVIAIRAFAQQPSPVQDASRYEGLRIAAIEFQPADQPLSKVELSRQLPFTIGSEFHEEGLRQAIQNLFASGRYADLAVDAAEVDGKLVLRFLTRPAYFVGRVLISGVKAPPSASQMIDAARLRLGTNYADSQRVQAMESIRDLLRQNGFYRAQVRSGVEYNERQQQANIRFEIESDDRARFEQPAITGNAEQLDSKIIRATHWKRLYGLLGWQQVTQLRVRQGVDNVREYYEKHNFFDSRVTLTRLEYAEATNTLKPTLDVRVGPKVIIRTVGANISSGKLKQLVPLFQEHAIDPDLLLEGQRNIQQYLFSEGYFEAKVAYEVTKKTAPQQVVTYSVIRGNHHRFVSLQISGNRYFTTQTIRERLFIEPASFPRFPSGRFSEAYLRQDLQAIRNLYQSNGFRDVNVLSRSEDNYRGKSHRLALFIEINEGPQWLVSDLVIEGAREGDLPVLRSRLASFAGQPFSEANVATDRENLLNHYYGLGYLNASFDYSAVPAQVPNHVHLRYILHPGNQRYVRNIFISGLETTKSRLVTNRIELKQGEPLSLPQQTDSQRRLYDLGIFARVNTAVQNPQGDEEFKNVLYDMEEARHYSLNVGVGAQIARIGGGVTTLDNPAGTTGFAPRFAFGITRLNFLGLGQTIGLQSALSTIEQRVALTYFIPHFVSRENLSLSITTLLDNSSDVRTFTANRREASIQLGQRLSRAYTIQGRLVFRNVTLSNLKINLLLVPLLSQPETVGMTEFAVIADKRDDPTDAHHGIYTTLNLSYAPGLLGSQSHFARGQFRNSTYHALGRDWVFARSTQFGLISRLGGRPDIPLAERLYSGGSTSIRAFPDFQAGPRDLTTGFPLGGNVLFTNTLELRFPLYGDNLAMVLFHDAGNVYRNLNNFSLRFRQRDLRDFSYTVQSAGLGLRYRTPIGPLRLDFSFSPNAPRFFGLKGTQQDYINGTAIPTVQKINAFQFHFSLGQAF